jgi:hypothetical protein
VYEHDDQAFTESVLHEHVHKSYVAFNTIQEPNLSAMQFASFFNMCRLQGISFDLKSGLGTAFMLWDSLASGMVGLLAVADKQAQAITVAVRALSFLQLQAKSMKTLGDQPDELRNLDNILASTNKRLKVLHKEAESEEQHRTDALLDDEF